MSQLDLFDAVKDAFSLHEEISTGTLYREVARLSGLSEEDFRRKEPIGKSGQQHSKAARAVRWAQQTLKQNGLVERVPGKRGQWRVTREGKEKLSRLNRGNTMLAFNTRLGLAVWGDCRDAVAGLSEEIHLVLTSPPYPIAKGRSYGGIAESEYVDWLCGVLAPFVEKLADGGSIALNISNDIFEKGKPSRSLYLERLTLALNERFGLHLMDRLIWNNPSKPPGPVQWASKERYQLNVGYEPILWFCRTPQRCRANNRRVLEPHSERHQRLIVQGGPRREGDYGNGAYRLRPGKSFATPTAGRIPKNVVSGGHGCASQRRYKANARSMGLPVHGAPMPLWLARKLIRFLTRENDLVVDCMAGSLTTGEGAELENRRWLCIERYWEYIAGGSTRFDDIDWRHPVLAGGCEAPVC